MTYYGGTMPQYLVFRQSAENLANETKISFVPISKLEARSAGEALRLAKVLAAKRRPVIPSGLIAVSPAR